MITKGIFLGIRGRHEEAMALLDHALRYALNRDIGAAALRAYFNLTDRLTRSGRVDAAIAQASEGVALARRLGDRFWECSLLANMLYPLYIVGRWDEALQRAAEMPDLERLGSQRTILSAAGLSGLIHVNRGDLDAARRLLEASAEMETSPDVQDRSNHIALRAALRHAERRFAEALEHGSAGFTSVAEMGGNE